jgi:hypothetical protein
MSSGEIPNLRMFSTIPAGDTPVSNSSVRSCSPLRSRTSAEKPGSAISASGTPSSGLVREPARGIAPKQRLWPVDPRDSLLVDEQRIGQVVDQIVSWI